MYQPVRDLGSSCGLRVRFRLYELRGLLTALMMDMVLDVLPGSFKPQ